MKVELDVDGSIVVSIYDRELKTLHIKGDDINEFIIAQMPEEKILLALDGSLKIKSSWKEGKYPGGKKVTKAIKELKERSDV